MGSCMKYLQLAIALGWALSTSSLPAQIASRYTEDYPKAESKKGLQVEIVEDALALGVKHAALNVNLSQVVAPQSTQPTADQLTWRYQGNDYFFNRAYVSRLDRDIQALSSQGVLVNLILLVYQSHDETINRLLLHPNYDKKAPNRLSAFNTVTPDGRNSLAATIEFLAERWSRPDRKHGRVVGYIVGNEVNSHWWWSNMGRASLDEFTADYHEAVRLVHDSVRRQSSWARVYISLEHHWNIRYPAGDESQAFAGKEFLDLFAKTTREYPRSDFPWNIAFHPYPENLFQPKFWQDQSALPAADTPRITFKNLDVLTDYLQRPELLYQAKPRRVILSEQGFHTPEGPEGEIVQAAAYCYAYKLVEANDAIDAFILHRHVDHPHEGGLLLGLRRYSNTNERPKKRIYECFRLADTQEWETAFEFALPVVGLQQWPVDEQVGTHSPR